MKLLWRTGIILTALAGATSTAILIFLSTNNSTIAFSEEWIATEVADGNSITVRQTDGSQMSVELCGIDAPEVQQGEAPGQLLCYHANRSHTSISLPKTYLTQ